MAKSEIIPLHLRVPVALRDQFKAACAEEGVTMRVVLMRAMRVFIADPTVLVTHYKRLFPDLPKSSGRQNKRGVSK
jgi:hypothetical protein